jgi:hypothetical protein
LIYAIEMDLAKPNLDKSNLDLLAESISRDVMAQPVPDDEAGTPESGPDAALLGLVAEFRVLDAALMTWNEHDGAPEDLVNQIYERWWKAARQVQDTTAITAEGSRAKCVWCLTVFSGIAPRTVGRSTNSRLRW